MSKNRDVRNLDRENDKVGMMPEMKNAIGAVGFVFLFLMVAGQAQAHVSLDYPNGGEKLDAGSVVQILWSDVISHGPATYDLWYSTTGQDGPWIAIESGLASGTFSFDWVVPDAPSNQVRLRVKQDNSGTDYFDISDSNLAIVGVSEDLVVELEAEKDATIYEDGDGTAANGVGSYLFTGRNAAQGGAAERRALLGFPVDGAVPAGSTITSVSLELTMSRTISGVQTVGLYRLLENWSEGPSDPSGQEGSGVPAAAGDVTWVYRKYPGSPWATPGGSFAQSASATVQVGGDGSYSFTSTPGLVADVQGWLDEPSTNFGWALVMDSPASSSAKRFDSREHDAPADRPVLIVAYESGSQGLAAAFDFEPTHPLPGDEVQFSDRSSGQPVSWQWDFGDGQTSRQQNPTHTFDTFGVFTVTLVVGDGSGDDTAVAEVLIGAAVRRPSRRVLPSR